MSVTIEDVRASIDVDEPDYPRLAASLGAESLPHLETLAQGTDPMLASKAIYLASLIGGAGAERILEVAVRHDDPVRRMAAASGVAHLAEPAAEALAERLLDDADVGVRKVMLNRIAMFPSHILRDRVRKIADTDAEPLLRRLATEALER